MRLEHQFTVDVPLEQACRAVFGADAIASSLPRAQLRAVDGLQTGRVALDAAHDVWAEGRIVTVDRDDDERTATVALQGRQVGGPGVGSVLLRSHATAAGASATKVSLSADVQSAGHDPGNGFEAAANRLLEQVGERLAQRARELPAEPSRRSADDADRATVAAPSPSPTRKRLSVAVGLGVGAAGATVAAVALRRRRAAP